LASTVTLVAQRSGKPLCPLDVGLECSAKLIGIGCGQIDLVVSPVEFESDRLASFRSVQVVNERDADGTLRSPHNPHYWLPFRRVPESVHENDSDREEGRRWFHALLHR